MQRHIIPLRFVSSLPEYLHPAARCVTQNWADACVVKRSGHALRAAGRQSLARRMRGRRIGRFSLSAADSVLPGAAGVGWPVEQAT